MSQHRRMADPQTCSTPGCGHEAAYTTRKRPAWCEPCLADILRMGGLTPVAPFPGNPKRYWRTRCNRCGVVADYRLEYVLDKNAYAEPTCRVCYWIEWAGGVQFDVIPDEDIRALADENGYDLATLVLPQTRSSEPVVLRCRACDKLKVSRVLDIQWGCECSRAKRRAEEEAARLAKKRARRGYVEPPPMSGVAKAFATSGLPAVEWWDHDRNPAPLFAAVYPSARKAVWWVGPTCGHRFERPVAAMASEAVCPTCGAAG